MISFFYMNKELSMPNSSFVFQLTSYGLLKIGGRDSKKLLQGQLTCDLENLKENETTWGAHCNPKGRIISLFHLFRQQTDYYLLMQQTMLPLAFAALKKYAIFYQVELAQINDQTVFLSPIPTIDTGMIKFFVNHNQIYYMAYKPNLKQVEKNEQSWKKILIDHFIPTLYPETSGKLLPHDIYLDKLNGLCFNKGCYTGQEIIARMHYLGKRKNQLYRATLPHHAPLKIGADIHYSFNQQPRSVGTVLDYYHADHHYHVLMIVDEAHALNQHIFLANHPNYFFEINEKA